MYKISYKRFEKNHEVSLTIMGGPEVVFIISNRESLSLGFLYFGTVKVLRSCANGNAEFLDEGTDPKEYIQDPCGNRISVSRR